RIRARTPRVRFVSETAAPLVRVTFERAGGDVAATVELLRDGTAATVRRLKAHSCDDAADGVALILAITLDPTPEPTSIGGQRGSSAGTDKSAPPQVTEPARTLREPPGETVPSSEA